MATTSTLTGDVTFGGNILADADEAKAIFAAVKTAGNKITLGGGGTVKTAGDLEVAGGDIVATTIINPANVFATTTGTVTVGGGAVNIGATGSTTTVDGALTVGQATTLTGAATLSSTLDVAGNATFNAARPSATTLPSRTTSSPSRTVGSWHKITMRFRKGPHLTS